MKILQIANYVEGKGGISIQVGLLRKNLQAEGYICDIISTKGSLGRRLRAITKLLRIGKDYDIFHIHACSGRGFFPAVVGVVASRLLYRPAVLTYHGGGAEVFFKKNSRLVHYCLSRTSENIALSGFIGKVFEQYGIHHTVIPNIIEITDNQFRLRVPLQPRFISIRALENTYNIECTLRAFMSIINKWPDSSLLIVGDGSLRTTLESFVEEHGIRGVKFVGQINNDQIYNYLDQADIMISSSRADNMPVSILEGFNAGVLIIATNVGGIPYLIQDGENGYLFDYNNVDQLINRIETALLDQEHSKRIISCARDSLKRYQWDYCKTRLLQLYQDSIYSFPR